MKIVLKKINENAFYEKIGIGYWGWVVRTVGTNSFRLFECSKKAKVILILSTQEKWSQKDYLDNAHCRNMKKQKILCAGTIFQPGNSIQMIEKVFCIIGHVKFQSSFKCFLKCPQKVVYVPPAVHTWTPGSSQSSLNAK